MQADYSVSILVLMEDDLKGTKRNYNQTKLNVSILVLMEDDLKAADCFAISENAAGFNPCFNGR